MSKEFLKLLEELKKENDARLKDKTRNSAQLEGGRLLRGGEDSKTSEPQNSLALNDPNSQPVLLSALDSVIEVAHRRQEAEKTEAAQAFFKLGRGPDSSHEQRMEEKAAREKALQERQAFAEMFGQVTPAAPHFRGPDQYQTMTQDDYLLLNQSRISSFVKTALFQKFLQSNIRSTETFELYEQSFIFNHDPAKNILYFTPKIAPQYQIMVERGSPGRLVIIDTAAKPPEYYDANAQLSGQGGKSFDQIKSGPMKLLLIKIERYQSMQDQGLLEGTSQLPITRGAIATDDSQTDGDLVFTAAAPPSEILPLDSQAVAQSLKKSLLMTTESNPGDNSEVITCGKRFIFSRNKKNRVCYFRPKDAGKYMISISTEGQLLIADQSNLKYYGVGGTPNPVSTSPQKTLLDFNAIRDPAMNEILRTINHQYFKLQNPGEMKVPPAAGAPSTATTLLPTAGSRAHSLVEIPKTIKLDSLNQKALKDFYNKIKSLKKEVIDGQVDSGPVSIKLIKSGKGTVSGQIRFMISSQEELCTLEITRAKAKGKEDVYSLETSPNFDDTKFDAAMKLIGSRLKLDFQTPPSQGSSRA